METIKGHQLRFRQSFNINRPPGDFCCSIPAERRRVSCRNNIFNFKGIFFKISDLIELIIRIKIGINEIHIKFVISEYIPRKITPTLSIQNWIIPGGQAIESCGIPGGLNTGNFI